MYIAIFIKKNGSLRLAGRSVWDGETNLYEDVLIDKSYIGHGFRNNYFTGG